MKYDDLRRHVFYELKSNKQEISGSTYEDERTDGRTDVEEDFNRIQFQNISEIVPCLDNANILFYVNIYFTGRKVIHCKENNTIFLPTLSYCFAIPSYFSHA